MLGSEAGLADQSLENLRALGIVERCRELLDEFADATEVHCCSVKDEQAFSILDIPCPQGNEFVNQQVFGTRNADADTGIIADLTRPERFFLERQPGEADVHEVPDASWAERRTCRARANAAASGIRGWMP